MMKGVSKYKDHFLADCISDGLTKKIEEYFNRKNLRQKYLKVFVREYSEESIEELDRDYNPEEDSDYGFCHDCFGTIDLRDTSINYKTLYAAAQCFLEPKGYKKAFLVKHKRELDEDTPGTFVDQMCIIYYKDLKDIDFADPEIMGFELSHADDDFTERFNKKDIDAVVKKYTELVRTARDRAKYAKQAQEEVEKFKENLSNEELLAINVLDV